MSSYGARRSCDAPDKWQNPSSTKLQQQRRRISSALKQRKCLAITASVRVNITDITQVNVTKMSKPRAWQVPSSDGKYLPVPSSLKKWRLDKVPMKPY